MTAAEPDHAEGRGAGDRTQIKKYAVLDFSGWEDGDAMSEAFAKLYEGMLLNYRKP